MDKPEANPDGSWSSSPSTSWCPRSGAARPSSAPSPHKTGEGIDNLLEMVNLTAEMQELKASPNRSAHGAVIEARLDKGRGPWPPCWCRTALLKRGDVIIAGTAVGRVRAMTSAKGEKLTEAGPSVPVEIIGMGEVPGAGDDFHAVADGAWPASWWSSASMSRRWPPPTPVGKVSLEDLFSQIKQGEMKDLNIIVKADVQGSAEGRQGQPGEAVQRGSPGEGHPLRRGHHQRDRRHAGHHLQGHHDVGFNVRPDHNAKESAARNNVDMRMYRVIYDLHQ